MFIIVVGCGKIGYFLAKDLVAKNHELCVVERESEKTRRVRTELPGAVVVRGDGCDPNVLDRAGISRAEVLVACTGHDEDNLVIGHVAKSRYPKLRTVARVNNPKNEAIFQSLGLDAVVNATTMLINVIEHELTVGDLVPLMVLRKTGMEIVELLIDDRSRCVNQLVSEINLPHDCVLVSLVRGDHAVVPKGDTQLLAGDEVVALVPAAQENQLREILVGIQQRSPTKIKVGHPEPPTAEGASRKRGLARLLGGRS